MNIPVVYTDISQFQAKAAAWTRKLVQARGRSFSGICGFDGFIDTFIQMQNPATMAEFGPKVAAAAGISASYPVYHLGDKFGGNGPLFASALHGLLQQDVSITYIGALGADEVLPIFQEALAAKTKRIHTLTTPAHSDCLEFKDGKIMLSDMRSCADIHWDRLIERIGSENVDALLKESDFIAAVNWGKLVNVGTIWENLVRRLAEMGVPPKQMVMLMDLAEFEQRPTQDRMELIALLSRITAQCSTMLSLNLKEAWQMAEVFNGDFHGKKSPHEVAHLAAFLKEAIDVDRLIIHPNDGAACASNDGCVYVPGPFCRDPLISIGAGDNFGAGCLAAMLCGFDDLEILLMGNCTSGYFVRSGKSPSFAEMAQFAALWSEGRLSVRL